ncbi:MAG TPA: DUF2848 family protein [Cerasibacillus sp.]|uniref:DUF2848 family protein n=1 Tax=Cerasibacillus sp. TaxID=2498711 RepID=UPI002F3EF732
MRLLLDDKQIEVCVEDLVIAGYTSRNQEDLKAHIRELEEIGVQPPPQIPMIYHVSKELLDTKGRISTIGKECSGEAEIVLLEQKGKWYLGLGSDHTDRQLETFSIQKSKQVCGKPITNEFWDVDKIIHHWDEIELKSWIINDQNEKILYQNGKLDSFMLPKDLIKVLEERNYPLKNVLVFGGTIPLLSEEFLYSTKFEAQLIDPKLNRKLTLIYEVKELVDTKS